MLKRIREILDFRLMSADGLIGKIDDFLIQDDSWCVRYLVVNADNPFFGRKILLSAAAIQGYDVPHQTFATPLDYQQISSSPRMGEDQQISRQYEEALVNYYGWPIYWLGRTVFSAQKLGQMASDEATHNVSENGCAKLRSAKELQGYQILAENGEAGFVRDLVINLNSWIVDYVVANPATWLPSESSMLSTKQIDKVDWSNQQIVANLQKKSITAVENSGMTSQSSPARSQWSRTALPSTN